jgi:hypothetical protein
MINSGKIEEQMKRDMEQRKRKFFCREDGALKEVARVKNKNVHLFENLALFNLLQTRQKSHGGFCW